MENTTLSQNAKHELTETITPKTYLLNDRWNEYGDEGDEYDIKLHEWLN